MTNQAEKKKKVVAKWDAIAHRAWIDIVLEEIAAHNRPQGLLNSVGYANLVYKFEERTGRSYDRIQMKNRWDTLKGEYGIWKTLKLHASGLGRDPKTGTIAASKEWWAEKIEVYMNAYFLFSLVLCINWYKRLTFILSFAGHTRLQEVYACATRI